MPIKQPNGTYAFQSYEPHSKRTSYVAATNGGGYASPKVGANERFKVVETSACAYTVQTAKNFYLAYNETTHTLASNVTNPWAPPAGFEVKLEFLPTDL